MLRRLYEQAVQDPDVIYEALDPDVERDTTASDLPEAGVYRGHEGVKDYRRRFWGAWETPRNEPEEFIDAGDNVAVVTRMGGRGKGSGVEVDACFAVVWTFSEGKATRVALHRDRATALEAVGLGD